MLKAVQAEADKIRDEVLSETESIKVAAREEAEQIKKSVLDEIINIREGADKYAENVLSTLDRNLTEMHSIVKNGQQHLEAAKEEAMASMPNAQEEVVEKKENRILSYKIKR